MNHGFCFNVREIPLFEALDFGSKTTEVFLKAQYGTSEFHPEVESRRVLAPEGDHVIAESEVVADEDGKSRTKLDGHGFVIRGAQPQGSTSVDGLGVGELQNTEEDGAVAPQGEAFLLDADLVLFEDHVELTSSTCGMGLKVRVASGESSARSSARLTRSVSTWDTSWPCCICSPLGLVGGVLRGIAAWRGVNELFSG